MVGFLVEGHIWSCTNTENILPADECASEVSLLVNMYIHDTSQTSIRIIFACFNEDQYSLSTCASPQTILVIMKTDTLTIVILET